MKTTYLTKQHQRALFYLECIDRVMRRILNAEDTKRKIESKEMFLHFLYDAKYYDKTISNQREFSIWLMTRYNKVIDNITAHSYAK